MLVRLLLLAWLLIGSAEAGVRSDGIRSDDKDNRHNPRNMAENILESKDHKTLGKNIGINNEIVMPWFEENYTMDKAKKSYKIKEENLKKLRDMQIVKNKRQIALKNKILRVMRSGKIMRKASFRNKIWRKTRIMIFLRLQKRDKIKKMYRKDKILNRKNSYFSK